MIGKYFPPFLSQFVIGLVGEKCFDSILVDMNIQDISCLSLYASKAIGIAIILGGALVKIPQIRIIWRDRSAEGISLFGNIVELATYMIAVSYNFLNQFPFTTYGESVFITVQNMIIVATMLYLQNFKLLIPFIIAIAGFAFLLFNVNMQILSTLQSAGILFIITSRVPQIYTNIVNGSTGKLSAITVIMFAGGSLARVFTTLKEVDDVIILAGYLTGAFLNLVLAFQVFYYWGKSSKGSSDEKKSTKKKSNKAD